MADFQITVTLDSRFCYKGHIFALLKGAPVECPYCLQRELDETRGYWRNAQDGNTRRDKQIAALQGVITKLKGAKK